MWNLCMLLRPKNVSWVHVSFDIYCSWFHSHCFCRPYRMHSVYFSFRIVYETFLAHSLTHDTVPFSHVKPGHFSFLIVTLWHICVPVARVFSPLPQSHHQPCRLPLGQVRILVSRAELCGPVLTVPLSTSHLALLVKCVRCPDLSPWSSISVAQSYCLILHIAK